MTRVTRIRGVAGAGKTTETMRCVRKLRDEHGYGPRDFRFLSFSRSHAADLRGDVLEAWGDRLDEMDEDEIEELKDNVSTLHSLCSQLTLTTTIITPESDEEFYDTFWSSRGFEFDTDDVDAQFISPEEMENGERNRVQKLLAADQLLAQLGAGLEGEGIDLEPSAIRHIPVEINLRAARIIDLIEDWRDFKREHGVKEHHDYVLDAANASYTPDCKVLVVDEMQDYSPLEYSVVRDWIDSGDLDHAILAGDENQSIYSFRLADPRYFTGREVDEEVVLTESYRCPRKVCEVARRVCPGSNITPAQKDDGIFMDATITNEDQLGRLVQQLLGAHPTHPNGSDSPPLFILTRTNRQAAKVGRSSVDWRN